MLKDEIAELNKSINYGMQILNEELKSFNWTQEIKNLQDVKLVIHSLGFNKENRTNSKLKEVITIAKDLKKLCEQLNVKRYQLSRYKGLYQSYKELKRKYPEKPELKELAIESIENYRLNNYIELFCIDDISLTELLKYVNDNNIEINDIKIDCYGTDDNYTRLIIKRRLTFNEAKDILNNINKSILEREMENYNRMLKIEESLKDESYLQM